MQKLAICAVALAAALTILASQAKACLVCIELPEDTIADRVLAAEVVVLAREDATRPFIFRPIATLKGSAEGVPIAQLVDSATRRWLATDPAAAILLIHDGDNWTRLADADGEVGDMIRDILAAGAEWDSVDTHPARFAYFAERHDHPNATIRKLALAEISRASYAEIRSMTPRLTRPEIVRILTNPKWGNWAPIHILFLGLSDDPTDHALVRRAFSLAAANRGLHLAAWATALVEIDGPPAIAHLRDSFLESVEGRRSIVVALITLAGGGAPELRPVIDATFHSLASASPELAGEVARHLLWAEDFSQAAYFAELLASGTIDDPATEVVITVYLHTADVVLGSSFATERVLQ